MAKRVLIVDDQRHVRTLLESALEPLLDLGLEVAVTESAAEALAAANERMPDLVLVDANMPDLDGFELSRLLTSKPTTMRPYIIVLGNKGCESDKIRAHEAGANDFLVKPFDPDEVLDLVSAVLGLDPR